MSGSGTEEASAPFANTLWARAFVDELARLGLREVVVAPGSRSTPLVMACARDERLRVRVHLDERSAAFFALGVGKATGVPAAVVTTSGTAVANCFPAVVEAAQAGVPLLVLTADRPARLRGADANQAIDQVGIFGAYPRAAFDLPLPTAEGPALRHLRTVAVRAFGAATGPDAGPVHVNLAFDKPLEPVEPDPTFVAAHPIAARGRADGAPFVRLRSAQRTLADGALDAIAASIASPRGVIVAGPTERAGALGPAALRLAAATGYPLLADPLSGARYGACGSAHVVAAYDLFLRDAQVRAALEPTSIVRVGASPTSAALAQWLLDHNGVQHVVIDGGGRWKDHGATATDYVHADPVDTLDRLTAKLTGRTAADADPAWERCWRAAQEATLRAIGADADSGAHEGDAVAAVLDALPADACLVVSSSMPIRDLDAFGHPRPVAVRVVANRGASGIDGVVSTAFGVAASHDGPTVCIIGDVAFFHDRNGLLWSREADARVVFVVIDNDGGGIFHMLPIAEHEPDFTRLFATPHGLDPGDAAESHGLAHSEVETGSLAAAVTERLATGATAVVRVRSDRARNHRRHLDIQAAVARSVRAALG